MQNSVIRQEITDLTHTLSCNILELDFEFLSWLTSQVQGMRTKRFWQPALRKLFSFPAIDDRQAALQFLLETMKKFQVIDNLACVASPQSACYACYNLTIFIIM